MLILYYAHSYRYFSVEKKRGQKLLYKKLKMNVDPADALLKTTILQALLKGTQHHQV
jgi:hypothetical protein